MLKFFFSDDIFDWLKEDFERHYLRKRLELFITAFENNEHFKWGLKRMVKSSRI